MTDPLAKVLGEWSQTLNGWSVFFRISLSVILSAVIGYERSSKRHSVGFRTFILVSLAMTVTMLLDESLTANGQSGLFILSCAGIVGVAIISVHSLLVSSRSQIRGLTTAVGLWTCAIIGLTIGAGYYTITLISFVVLLCCLAFFPSLERYLKNRSNHFEIHLELKNNNYLQNFVGTIRRLGLTIDNIEANPAYANSGLSVYSIAISITSQELKKYKTHTEIIEALRSLDYIYHIEEMWL